MYGGNCALSESNAPRQMRLSDAKYPLPDLFGEPKNANTRPMCPAIYVTRNLDISVHTADCTLGTDSAKRCTLMTGRFLACPEISGELKSDP
jgi:hypothetical protein